MVKSAALADLPVHACGAAIEELHAVDAEIANVRLRMLGEHQAERDEASAVLRPELEVRQRLEIRVECARLRGPARHLPRPHGEDAPKAAAQSPEIAEAARRHGVQDFFQL